MFIQESESSHRANLVKNFLMKNLTKDLLKTLNAPQLSWIAIPLIIKMKIKVHED